MKEKKKKAGKNDSLALAVDKIKVKPYLLIVFLLWGLYLYVTFNSPNSSSSQLRITPQTLDLIRLTIAVPYLLIWLAAAYSFVKIKRYSEVISPSKEAKAFGWIANGVFVLMLSLIFSTLVSSVRSALVREENVRPFLTILTNYLYVFPYLIAFAFLLSGAAMLAKRALGGDVKRYILSVVPLALLAYVWLEWIFTNDYRTSSSVAGQYATYYLKDSLLILTIVIPSLVAWGMGFLAALKIKEYRSETKGIIYKSSLSSFVYGLIGVIVASILLQALLSLGSQRLLDLGLGRLLALIYLFLVVQGLGFVSIARGAHKLTKIEVV